MEAGGPKTARPKDLRACFQKVVLSSGRCRSLTRKRLRKVADWPVLERLRPFLLPR